MLILSRYHSPMHCADKLRKYEHKLGLLVALKLVLFGILKLAKTRLKLTLEYLINRGLLTMTYYIGMYMWYLVTNMCGEPTMWQ